MRNGAETVLIVGGGIAGTAAALHISGAGQRALVIDAAPVIGGSLLLLDKTFPTDSCGVCFMAPDPPAICPFFECERDPLIDLLPSTTLTHLEGKPGDFKATLISAPRTVDSARCTACGLCAEVCPETAEVDLPGGTRRAIYQPVPQAVPPAYVIDAAACTRCGRCIEVCPYAAIDLDQKAVTRTVKAAAVILAPGFGPNNALARGAYGYGHYPNVVTSIEYERMLSTSNPGRGIAQRPSDDQPAQRIGIIHCAGSRDCSCGVPYCSSSCCMIAAKQAGLTVRRNPQADVTVFTMDVRAAGRGYERYVAAVRSQPGVTYRRSLISAIKLDPATQNLVLQYAESGRSQTEIFDLVVLEVGMVVPAEIRELAERIDIELNSYGFAATAAHDPVVTSRPGVFVAGAFREPKDIAATASEAAAAAARALAVTEPLPARLPDTSDGLDRIITPSPYDAPVIGIFLNADEPEIASILDMDVLIQQAQTLSDVVYAGVGADEATIRSTIASKHLTHVIIGGCSARRNGHHYPALDGVPVTWIALGAADAYVHLADLDQVRQKAHGLLRMAVEQARRSAARPQQKRLPEQRAVVLGGGVAGLHAALTLSEQGVETHLVERSERLGGQLPAHTSWLADLIARVETDPLITIHRSVGLIAFQRQPGYLTLAVQTPEGEQAIEAGALVVATGAQEYRPQAFNLNSGIIITQSEMDARLRTWEVGGSAHDIPASIAMIQCAGTRDEAHPYCSRTCCAAALSQAVAFKRIAPESQVTFLFRDIVTPGFSEDLYFEVRKQGVLFLRYRPETPPRISGQTIVVVDDVLDEEITLQADLIILSSGIVPDPETPALAKLLGLPLDSDGFFKPVNIKSQGMDLPYPGMYLAGLAGGPATLEESIEQGLGAGLRAALFLRRGLRTPLEVATVNERICSGCGLCVSACPANARSLDEDRGVAVVDAWLCTGCGTCAAVCPNGASSQTLYEAHGVLDALDVALG